MRDKVCVDAKLAQIATDGQANLQIITDINNNNGFGLQNEMGAIYEIDYHNGTNNVLGAFNQNNENNFHAAKTPGDQWNNNNNNGKSNGGDSGERRRNVSYGSDADNNNRVDACPFRQQRRRRRERSGDTVSTEAAPHCDNSNLKRSDNGRKSLLAEETGRKYTEWPGIQRGQEEH